MNREFWRGSNEPEVTLLEKEIAARKFDGAGPVLNWDAARRLLGKLEQHHERVRRRHRDVGVGRRDCEGDSRSAGKLPSGR